MERTCSTSRSERRLGYRDLHAELNAIAAICSHPVVPWTFPVDQARPLVALCRAARRLTAPPKGHGDGLPVPSDLGVMLCSSVC